MRGAWRPETMQALRLFLNYRLITSDSVQVNGTKIRAKEFLRAHLLQATSNGHGRGVGDWAFLLYVEVKGRCAGREARRIYRTIHPGPPGHTSEGAHRGVRYHRRAARRRAFARRGIQVTKRRGQQTDLNYGNFTSTSRTFGVATYARSFAFFTRLLPPTSLKASGSARSLPDEVLRRSGSQFVAVARGTRVLFGHLLSLLVTPQ